MKHVTIFYSRLLLFFLAALAGTNSLRAQDPDGFSKLEPAEKAPKIRPAVTSSVNTGLVFEENRNQWPGQVRFMADAGGGVRLFMEDGRFTYVKYDQEKLAEIHDKKHGSEEDHHGHPKYDPKNEVIDMHAFRVYFTGANTGARVTGQKRETWYRNYFIGNDQSRWASNVGVYKQVQYSNIYPGIDLLAYDREGWFKYDFIVTPGADASQLKMRFEGVEGIYLRDNRLVIPTSAGDLIEDRPYSYQLIGGKKVEVPCLYELSPDGNSVSFVFPGGYDENYQLIVDPTLVAATYSGAPASTMTFGHCATYDLGANIYTGGECFNTGYPTTPGAFQMTFGGGGVDVAVSKLDPNGSTLIWCSYLGGNGSDLPNSLVTNSAGELYMLGTTDSPNYPTSTGCYDNSFNGTVDIALSALNSTGTALVGSTYVGGSNNDGAGGTFFMNGHDAMRGEVVIDNAGNPWVASYTNSSNYPTTTGAYDQSLNGGFDACVFRMTPNLATLQWSTFLGGTGNELGYGIRVNNGGEAFVCGPTSSSDFPITVGSYQTTYQGGTCDGYMTHFNAAGSGLVASSFFGTAQNDVNYFIALDVPGNPYIYGTTAGTTPTTVGVYSNAGSGNFVAKFDPNFNAPIFATQFGSPGSYMEPEAFMVDTCENLYMSGFTSTAQYPVTNNALYSTQPGGGSCYFIVLKQNATQLMYGTFYHGWHVDGGTSRFDPNGTIYQGICIGSGGATTPVWAFDNGTSPSSWDMFVVKIAFQLSGTIASASAAPSDTICAGSSISFTNSSIGVDYVWDFGDGSPTDTTTSPSHTYNTPGSYQVMLVAIDSTSCIVTDTTYLTITVLATPIVNLGPDTMLCNAASVLLDAGNPGLTYTWSNGATTQTITTNTPGTYWVEADNGVCQDSDTIVVSIVTPPSSFNDTMLCAGSPLTLDANNPGASYNWSTGATTQTINVSTSGIYWVDISSGSCVVTDSMQVTFIPYPVVSLANDTVICPNNTLTLDAQNPGYTYLWSTGATTQTITVTTPGTYSVTVTNELCSASDSTEVINIAPIALADSISICDVAGLTLDAGIPNATSYIWSTGETTQTIEVQEEGMYWVNVDADGCLISDTTYVDGELGGGTLYVPNTFTPNNNNLNERFMAVSSEVVYFHMMIFDRWGQLLLETDNIHKGWDGTYKGKIVQEDVYVYKIEYRTPCSEKTVRRIGHVLVLR